MEKKCSVDNDCDLELMCNIITNTCTCPEPYFWRNDIHACFGCAPGWLELNTSKCLLFAISHSPGATWYEAQTTCKALIAQPMMINSTDEFIDLQRKIEYLLNGQNALTATLYFHQGAWIQINNEWNESYTWCNDDKQRDSFDCVQIRQHNITNTICLQYVSCIEQSQYICEAPPLIRSELERNMAEAEHQDINDKNEDIMVRALPKTTLSALRTPPKTTPRPMIGAITQGKVTTQKSSSFNFNNIANVLTSGINAVGQISNAVATIYGSKNQNQNQNQQTNMVVDPSQMINQQMPQALASNVDENSKINMKNILFYGGLIFGAIILITIIIIIIVIISSRSKKKLIDSQTSIESTESYTSVISDE